MQWSREVQRWARAIATQRNVPLADVLSWDESVLAEEAARLFVDWATREATTLLQAGKEPPDTGHPSEPHLRAIYARLAAEDRARKAAANDAAFAELIEQGAFGG